MLSINSTNSTKKRAHILAEISISLKSYNDLELIQPIQPGYALPNSEMARLFHNEKIYLLSTNSTNSTVNRAHILAEISISLKVYNDLKLFQPIQLGYALPNSEKARLFHNE